MKTTVSGSNSATGTTRLAPTSTPSTSARRSSLALLGLDKANYLSQGGVKAMLIERDLWTDLPLHSFNRSVANALVESVHAFSQRERQEYEM